jgi:hypothetical protein
MPKQAVQPLIHSFVVCRQVFEDARTHEFILIGPCCRFGVPSFPGTIRFTVYAHLKLHGEYFPEFQLEDSDGRIIWDHRAPRSIAPVDPILPHQLVYYDVTIVVPDPGRYDLLLMGQGIEIARHALWVCPDRSPDD